MVGKLQDRVAIVTGAGVGIGAESARWMARESAITILADINEAAASEVAAEIVAAGGRAHARRVDISDEASVRALYEDVVSSFGPIRVLQNNAVDSSAETLGNDRDVISMDLDVWERTFAVNTRGTMLMTKYALPSMVEAGGGSIIHTSSAAAVVADIYKPAYGASKSALHAFTRSVATQYGKYGVRSNIIVPGMIMTEALRRSVPPAVVEMVGRHTLTPRLGRPADIAAMALMLASDESGFVTAQVIHVDGGNLAHFAHTADIFDEFMRDTAGAGTGRIIDLGKDQAY